MKRQNVWLIILAVMLSLVVAGCNKDDDGKKDKDDNKVTGAVTPSEEKPTDAASTPEGVSTIWKFTAPTDFGTIDLPEVIEEKATVPDNGSEIILLRTDISQSRETVFPALKSDNWVTGRDGQFVDYYVERSTNYVATDNGPRWAVEYTEGLNYTGTESGDSSDLTADATARVAVWYTTATDQFSNENAVGLDFFNVDLNDAVTQENIKRIVKTVYSERVAEVLLNITTEENLKGKYPNNLNLVLNYSQLEYRFVRTVNDNGANGKIEFKVEVTRSNGNSIKANTYYKSRLSECPYTPNDVFSGNIGGTDLYANPSEFANKVLSIIPDYTKTQPGSYPYRYSRYAAADGREYFSLDYECCIPESPYAFNIEYSFGLTSGKTDKVYVKVTGACYDFGGEPMDNYKKQIEQINQEFEVMFGVNPAITTDKLTTENESTWTAQVPVTVAFMGEELPGEIVVTMGQRFTGLSNGEWTLTIYK